MVIDSLCVQTNGYAIDFDDWHAEVHGTLPYSRLLKRDDNMRKFLQSIPLPKYIFTNADRKHADTCLAIMGVADLFEVGPSMTPLTSWLELCLL